MDTTGRNIVAQETDNKVVVEYPLADSISNGQRDLLSFYCRLKKFYRSVNETKNYLLVIDEVFDYLDDANYIAAQYFLSKFMKESKANIFVVLFTHLDPAHFRSAVFSEKVLNVLYLSDISAKATPQMTSFLALRQKLDKNNAADTVLYNNISAYFLHHHYVRMILLRRRLAHLHHQGIVHHLTLQNIRAIYNQIVGDYSISANVGANIMRNHYEYVYGLTQGGLAIPEYYNLANSLQAAKAYNYKRVKGINSLFGDITLGWKNMLYLEATIRGDKSSSLPSSNNTYVYPSVTGSWLFSELLKDKAPWLTYGKVRLGFAKVCLLPQPARMHTQ